MPSFAASSTLPGPAGGPRVEASELRAGENIGGYVLQQRVGAGGMGVVWEAHDPKLDRTVAIKLMRDAAPHLRTRFDQEVKITARLQHPSIVNIFEAGTWRGEPYYVMKLVRGESLEKKLSSPDLTSRLALLPSIIAVVDAVAYAHRERVIHRDLKPENILVGEFGEAVVIDWGLAKQLGTRRSAPVLDDTTISDETTAGSVIGTPSYMPPEQARGEQVDARADVYSLGAILYFLLSGQRPYADRSPAQIVTAVISGPPAPLPADAPPDLATIVGKAMARDANARYANAKELAEDLKRFQTGQLVASHRYSAGQLIARWVRRHRAAVAVGSTAFVVLAVAGVLGIRRILDEKQRATDAQVHAEEQRAEAEKLLTFMLGDLRKQLAPIGRVALLEKVATQAETYFEGPRAGAGDQHIRVRAMLAVGDVLLSKSSTPLALEKYQVAERIARAHLVLRPTDRDWRHDVAETVAKLGAARWQQGNLPAAIAAVREQASILSALADEDPGELRDGELAASHSVLGSMLSERGDSEDALAEFRAGLALSERVIARTPADGPRLRNHALLRLKIGIRLASRGDHDGALTELRGAVAIMEKLVATDPEAEEYQGDLAAFPSEVAKSLTATGDAAGALAETQAALKLCRVLANREPDQLMYQADLAAALSYVAILVKNRSPAEALPYLREARAIRDRLVAHDPTNSTWQAQRLDTLQNTSMLLLDLDHAAEALVEARTAVEIGKDLVAHDRTNTDWQRRLEYCHAAHGSILATLGKRDEALAAQRAGLAIAESLVAADPTQVEMQTQLAERHEVIAELLWSTDRQAAVTAYRAALEIYKRLAIAQPTNAEWQKIIEELTHTLARK